MADDAVGEGTRYWAFISYSHKDAAFGRRLHRRLEAYALPRRLVGRTTAQGTVPKRLTPIFRDREELPAANDLTAEVRTALKASRSLIVVCSRAAAASMWVSREVEVFRALHPTRPVLAALVDGEPGEAIPTALRQTSLNGVPVEPLAADFRKTGDGESLGLLKLVAGLLGIGLDELVQRDAQRRLQRVTAVTATALVAMVVMGLLTVFAFEARKEAERQHAEAEGLVGFMLTDLRYKLKGVGRLDVMSTVNKRALAYYDQESDSLSPESQGQRALLVLAAAEDAENIGQHKTAVQKIGDAWRTTSELLAANQNNPELIFDHAQSEYWVGYMAYVEGRFSDARNSFTTYKDLANRLVRIGPRSSRYLRELAFAEGDLCSVDLKPPKNPTAAVKSCSDALFHMENAARGFDHPDQIASDLANRHSWLASAYFSASDHRRGVAELLAQDQILKSLMQSDPQNMDLKESWIGLQRLIAWAESKLGQRDQAAMRLESTSKAVNELIHFDPTNKTWAQQRTKIDTDLLKLAENPAKKE